MNTKTKLLNDIVAYCELAEISPTTFGRTVLNDGNFVGRLRGGKGCTIDNYDKIVAYMEKNPPKTWKAKSTVKREAA